MAWKSIKLSANVSQKECDYFLENEYFMKLRTLFRIQKTCANGAITLKLYPHEGESLEDALIEACQLISLLHINFLQIDEHDLLN